MGQARSPALRRAERALGRPGGLCYRRIPGLFCSIAARSCAMLYYTNAPSSGEICETKRCRI